MELKTTEQPETTGNNTTVDPQTLAAVNQYGFDLGIDAYSPPAGTMPVATDVMPLQQQGADPAIVGAIDTALNMSFMLLAARRGSHWALTPEESKEAAQAYGDLMAHLWPDANGGPVVSACIVSAALVGPRVVVDMFADQEGETDAGKPE